MMKNKRNGPPSVLTRVLALVFGAVLLMPLYQNCSQFSSATAGSRIYSLSNGQATPVPTAAPTATPSPTPTPGPVTLLFSDDFDSMSWYNSVTNTGNWAPTSINSTAGGPGWSSEWDVNPQSNSLGINPINVSGGMLTIITDRAPASIQPSINNYQYTSTALRTVNPSFSQGYFEMSAQMPAGNGMWPAFWLLPADGAWPPEIDIVEILSKYPTVDFTTVHSTQNFAGSVSWSAGHWQLGQGNNVGVDVTAGFHTYGAWFTPTNIIFYFDRVEVFRMATPPDLVNRQMYIVLDTAVNGWGGSDNLVDSTTVFPAYYKIDYVKVYSSPPF